MQPMITTSNTGKIPANLKIPPLESSSGKISMTPGTPTPELEAAASPRSPPRLKMRRSHRPSMQTDKIPTLSDLNSISRRLFPKDSNHEDDDNVDSMSIDGILSEALLATPPRGGSSDDKHKMGPPQSRPPSFRKVDTCCHKTIPRHVTPPTSSAPLHAAAYGASSSSCSIHVDFIGGAHANSAFAASDHGSSWKKRIA